MNYAIVVDGIVANIIRLLPKNAGDFTNAVPCGDYLVTIGDSYDGNLFWRNGERVQTLSEYLAAKLADAEEALSVLGVNVVEGVTQNE